MMTLSKLEVGVSSGKLKVPPNSCIPRRAKMKMKRTRRTSRATMEAMESTRDLTKPPMAFQYL